ncbi:MAG TPA: transglutaminase family protein [Bryobacteraceae bacterium]|nr:transglutaminase family protein [Bryobacteraceae bacterium]
MRISVNHSTVYQYEDTVHPEPHTFRLRPREDGAQRLLKYGLEISPAPAGRTECLDQDGNVVLEAWFREPVQELAVKSSFEIETLRENPFDFVLAEAELNSLPLVYQEPLRSAVAPYLGTSNGGGLVRELARSLAQSTNWQTQGFLAALNRTLFGFQHVVRDDGPPQPPDVTLREREGSCRDLAVVFCAGCRAMGIPARFVSGYQQEAATQERAYMHAWAEVYLLGGGWRGYDPSQGLAVGSCHVAVAAAADPRLAAPITGSYRGAARSKMEFLISMQVQG